MKNYIIFTFVLLFSCSSNSQVIDCDFDSMNENIKRLITKYEPITSCKQAKGSEEFIAYRVNNNKYEVKIATSNLEIIELSQQKNSNGEIVSLDQFFNSIYSKNTSAINQYAIDQKKTITEADSYGVVHTSTETIYFSLGNTTSGPLKNNASVIFDDDKEKYWSVISDDRNAILPLLLD